MKVADDVRPPVVRSQVEPRIVERRRTVLVERRRTRRRRLIAAAVLVMLLAATAGALFSPLTDVDRIVIDGGSSLSEPRISELSGMARGDQLIAMDLASVREALRADPDLASVSVRREWPDTVRVVAVAETPSAKVRSGAVEVVVSRTGRVMGDGVPTPDVLPVIELADRVDLVSGEEVPDDVRAAVVALERMPPQLRSQVVAATFDRGSGFDVELDDSTEVRFGPVEDMPAKVVAVRTVLAQVVRECMEVLDVREPSRAAVTRRPDCVTPEPTETTPVAPSSEEADGGR